MSRERVDGVFGFGLRAEVGDGDVGSVFCQGEGDGTADAFSPSGDEGGLSVERHPDHGRLLGYATVQTM